MLPALINRRSSMREEFDNLFDRFFRDSWGGSNGGMIRGPQVPVSIWDDEQNIYVEVELPGVARDDVEVVVQDGSLFLRGERKRPTENRDYWYNEREFGRFERIVSLSEMVDPEQIEAEMHCGILSVKLVKKPESRRKRIEIKSN
jgi:HSP20 family protein